MKMSLMFMYIVCAVFQMRLFSVVNWSKKTIYVKVDEKNYTELTHARLSVCTIACTYVYAKSNAFKTIICRTKTEDLRKRNENRK